ncbi:hypothetical protein Ahy_B02g061266 [Arachis hypogaea]|uniref:Uncharacterized protein n=1 Tax=Arachis hypogaea TaxID=3818 RepID=A0A445AKM6_ARAHY|nr:hypothetical protein Ahy_B02g061266 [Arachis hypogaea]
MGTISQDHSKLDLDMIAEAMKPLVESDPSIKVKYIIAEVQARFNYTISLAGKTEVDSQGFRWMERILPSFAIVVLGDGLEDA